MTDDEVKSVRCLVQMLNGNPSLAMEAAKRFIGLQSKSKVGLHIIAEIAHDKTYGNWSRIAAVYALGLLGYSRASAILQRIAGDRTEQVDVRDHAIEAIGNLRAKASISTLGRILQRDEPQAIKRSTIYALSEIGSPPALSILMRFARTKPRSTLAREIGELFPSRSTNAKRH